MSAPLSATLAELKSFRQTLAGSLSKSAFLPLPPDVPQALPGGPSPGQPPLPAGPPGVDPSQMGAGVGQPMGPGGPVPGGPPPEDLGAVVDQILSALQQFQQALSQFDARLAAVEHSLSAPEPMGAPGGPGPGGF